jgi:hypothetical protein
MFVAIGMEAFAERTRDALAAVRGLSKIAGSVRRV